jgi:hypothetical protein
LRAGKSSNTETSVKRLAGAGNEGCSHVKNKLDRGHEDVATDLSDDRERINNCIRKVVDKKVVAVALPWSDHGAR